MNTRKRKTGNRTLSLKQEEFVRVYLETGNAAESYRQAYHPKQTDPQYHAVQAARCLRTGLVQRLISQARKERARRALLPLNDRLGILAANARGDTKTPAGRNASTRAIDVYSRLAGDMAPEKLEVTGKDGAPLAVEATIRMSRVPIGKRIKGLVDAKKRDEEAHSKA